MKYLLMIVLSLGLVACGGYTQPPEDNSQELEMIIKELTKEPQTVEVIIDPDTGLQYIVMPSGDLMLRVNKYGEPYGVTYEVPVDTREF